MLEDQTIDSVTYKRWLSVDKRTLESVVKDKDEFIDELFRICRNCKHSFVATMQKEFYNEVKASLKSGEVFVSCDFAENSTFVQRGEMQSYTTPTPFFILLWYI